MRCLEGAGEAGSAKRSAAPSEQRARKGPTRADALQGNLRGTRPNKK
ncbi:hypothetical protein [Thermaurantimonas aggregans]|nr:hypothetical protein [Thermaurantimonas aggregans]MCX8149672.1 hypothetical protein [Thermaurantimonas aggregans]